MLHAVIILPTAEDCTRRPIAFGESKSEKVEYFNKYSLRKRELHRDNNRKAANEPPN
jgi:hypothetical protein